MCFHRSALLSYSWRKKSILIWNTDLCLIISEPLAEWEIDTSSCNLFCCKTANSTLTSCVDVSWYGWHKKTCQIIPNLKLIALKRLWKCQQKYDFYFYAIFYAGSFNFPCITLQLDLFFSYWIFYTFNIFFQNRQTCHVFLTIINLDNLFSEMFASFWSQNLDPMIVLIS